MKVLISAVVAISFFAATKSQQSGKYVPEKHPPLAVQSCTKSGGCQSEQKGVVLDANWRWTHVTTGYKNCYTGNSWDAGLCPDGSTCSRNCALEGADYKGTYGVTTSGSSLKLDFVTASNVGSRLYLMDSETEYKVFKLKNREFTFDVDVSKLPCGVNGALYFVEMDGDGGMKRFPTNKAGAKYGTGYCDAQCPHDIKFINGEANCEDWTNGIGRYGSCCIEMDIWEANSISTAYTPHSCTVKGQTRCQGAVCGGSNSSSGACDRSGCDFNPYRLGDKSFFGPSPSFTVDSTKPFTVVTQFITSDKTDSGDLSEIRRLWVQNGKVIMSNNVTVGSHQYNSVTDDFCNAQKQEFGDKNDYESKGGHKAIGGALDRGMVLVMSLWDDHAVYMLWLDSNYPPNKSPSTPGVARGTCPTSSGRPDVVEKQHPDASVTYFNIKYGELDSTYE
jgi:cellulose 1,4-beta-cellobiosidase